MYDLGINCAGASAATDLKMSLSVTKILNNTETKFCWHDFILYSLSYYRVSYLQNHSCSSHPASSSLLHVTCHKVPVPHLTYHKYSHGVARLILICNIRSARIMLALLSLGTMMWRRTMMSINIYNNCVLQRRVRNRKMTNPTVFFFSCTFPDHASKLS